MNTVLALLAIYVFVLGLRELYFKLTRLFQRLFHWAGKDRLGG
jgi:hypothetical protein